MTKEQYLWRWLKKAVCEDLILERVENSVMSGMADVNGVSEGGEFWLELKTAARPVRQTTKVRAKFQSAQPHWLKKRWNAGCKAYVLLQVGSGRQASRYLIPGKYARKVAEGMTEKELAGVSLTRGYVSPEGLIYRAAKGATPL